MISLLIAGLLATAHGGEFDHRVHLEGFAQRRDVNQTGFPPPGALSEGFFLGDYAGTWTGDHLSGEIKPQVRGVWSAGVGAGAADPRAVTVATSARILNSRRLIGRSNDQEVYFDFDRLNLRYRRDRYEVYAGRRPISLGALTLIPIWNKLTLPLVFRAGPEWIENPDGAGGSVNVDDLRVRLIHVRSGSRKRDRISLVEARYARRNSEFQVLAGNWWGADAAGLTAATDWHGATLKFEGLKLFNTPDTLTQWGASVERALGAKWTVDFEYLHQSRGDARPHYGLSPPTRFQILNGCDYLLPYANYQWNSAWRFGAGVLGNLRDPSAMAIADVSYAWNDDLNLELKVKRAVGRAGSEFGAERARDPFGRTVGAPSTIYLGLSYTR